MKIGCGRYSETQWQNHLLETRSSSLTSHLRTCSACRNEIGDLQATVSAVKQTPLSHTAVRTSFVDRVLAEAGGSFSAAGAATTVASRRLGQQPFSRSGLSSWKFRWPSSWQGAVPIVAAACIAFLVLWTGAGGVDFLFPVKEGTPITSSPVTFQVAADFDASPQPFAMMEMSTFAADPDDMGLMSTFAAELDDMGMMSTFAAELDDPDPMATLRMISFVEESVSLATPDGVTSAIIGEEQRGWSLGFGRIPDAVPIHQPAGISTNWIPNATP